MATVSVSMTARSSNLDDQKSGVNIQTEGHTLTPPSIQNSPEETDAFGSTPSHSPSQSLVRRQTPGHPGTWYCLEIQVIPIEDGRTTPPSPHAWQAPVVEDMLWDSKSGLTETIIMGPGWAILFYGRQALGEGLCLGDKDMKDATTYQSWHWDLMVYHCAGCWDCTLLPYAICSLQGYLGELVRSLGTDITLDNVLAILDEHYNNVKALDTLNQELFQLWMGKKETVSDWGYVYQGISKFLQHHSQNTFCWTTSLSWSLITFTVGCLRGSK